MLRTQGAGGFGTVQTNQNLVLDPLTGEQVTPEELRRRQESRLAERPSGIGLAPQPVPQPPTSQIGGLLPVKPGGPQIGGLLPTEPGGPQIIPTPAIEPSPEPTSTGGPTIQPAPIPVSPVGPEPGVAQFVPPTPTEAAPGVPIPPIAAPGPPSLLKDPITGEFLSPEEVLRRQEESRKELVFTQPITATGQPTPLVQPAPNLTVVDQQGKTIISADQNTAQALKTSSTITNDPFKIEGKPASNIVADPTPPEPGPFPGPNPTPIPPGTEPVLDPVPGLPDTTGLPSGIPNFGSLFSSPVKTTFQALPERAKIEESQLAGYATIEPSKGLPNSPGFDTGVKDSVDINGGGTGTQVADTTGQPTLETQDVGSMESPAGFIYEGEAGNRFAEFSKFGNLATTDFFNGRDFTSGFTTSFVQRPEDIEGRLTNIVADILGFGSKTLPTVIQPGTEGRPEFQVGDKIESPIAFNPIDPDSNPLLLAAKEKIMAGVNGQIPGFETQAGIANDAMARSSDAARLNALALVGAGPGLDSGRGQAIMRQFELGILSSIGDFHNQLIVNRANLQRGYIDAALGLGQWQLDFKDMQNRLGTDFAENQFWKEIQYYDDRERFGVVFGENQYLASIDTEIRLAEIDQNWKFRWTEYKDAQVWSVANYGISYATLEINAGNMVNNWAWKVGQFDYLRQVDAINLSREVDAQQVADLMQMVQTLGPMMPEAVQAGMLGMLGSVLMGVKPDEAIQIYQNTFYNEDGSLKDIYKDPSEFEQFSNTWREALEGTINPDTGEIYTDDEIKAYTSDLFIGWQKLPADVLQSQIDFYKNAGDSFAGAVPGVTGEPVTPGPTALTGGAGTDEDPFVNIDEFDLNPFGTATVAAANKGNTFALDSMINEAIRIEDFSQLVPKARERIANESISTGRFDYDVLPGDIQTKIDEGGGPATTPWNVTITGIKTAGSLGTGRVGFKTTGNSGLTVGRWLNVSDETTTAKVKLVRVVELTKGFLRDRLVYTFLLPNGDKIVVDAADDDITKVIDAAIAASPKKSQAELELERQGLETTGTPTDTGQRLPPTRTIGVRR